MHFALSVSILLGNLHYAFECLRSLILLNGGGCSKAFHDGIFLHERFNCVHTDHYIQVSLIQNMINSLKAGMLC